VSVALLHRKSATPSGKGGSLDGRSIYLDTQATTPLDPRVLDAMMPYMTHFYGNPHSRTHHYGWEAEEAVETARSHVAQLLNCQPSEIIFTSGATESNNSIIKGIARFYKSSTKRHIITLQTEHKCVLDSCRALQQEGFDITYLPVKKDGLIDLELLKSSIRDDTLLVSVMMVNNEIGAINPIKEIGAICKERGVKFHTDAAQACGKIPLDVDQMNIDVLSLSSHKMYGPKGIGAMYVRRRPRVRLEALLSGGGQERGMRSGTLPAPLIVGLGEAARICKLEMRNDLIHVYNLSHRLYNNLTSKLDHIVLNGPPIPPLKLADPSNPDSMPMIFERYPGNVNLSFAYVEGESLLMGLKEVAVSSGSACTSASLEPSYVLRSLGVQEDMAHTSIRFGIGRFTTTKEVDMATDKCIKQVNRLREMSPLWEMVQEGIDPNTIQWTH
jgi:cysteine desulfurase